jgi:hypothetical protein
LLKLKFKLSLLGVFGYLIKFGLILENFTPPPPQKKQNLDPKSTFNREHGLVKKHVTLLSL